MDATIPHPSFLATRQGKFTMLLLCAADASVPTALDSGFQRALMASGVVLVAAAFIGLRTNNTRGAEHSVVTEGALPKPELATSVAVALTGAPS